MHPFHLAEAESASAPADGSPSGPQPPSRPIWQLVLRFVLAFAVLQAGWTACRGTWLERLVIHDATVKPAAALIRLLSPGIPATAEQASIKAPGGGLQILNGCEGTEVMFLLAAAFVAVPMPLGRKLLGLLLGCVAIFIANQGRILALFYAFRADRALFDMLHTAVLPAVLVALVTLYFYSFLQRVR